MAVAAIGVAVALFWQFLTVRYTYQGNWTGLFLTGSKFKVPPALATEHIYLFQDSPGYDGQFYHYVAHDPLLRKGFANYIDLPGRRYERILVPALAFLLAAGQQPHIDTAFIAVNLLFLFLGAYWLSRYVTLHGRHPAWGLLFVLAPAVLISLDRLTVDLAFTAWCVGLALYATEERTWKLYVVLLLASLTRETGLLLNLACCLASFSERRFVRGLVFATAALPTLLWYAFVRTHTAPLPAGEQMSYPLGGLIGRMLHPFPYPFVPVVAWVATALDYLALGGMLLAFALAFWLLRNRWQRSLQVAILLLAISGIAVGGSVWAEVYAFGRVFSPLLVLIALQFCTSGSWLTLLPLAMVTPRVALQLLPQVWLILRGLVT